LFTSILPYKHNEETASSLAIDVRGEKHVLEGIPHIQAISTKLSLDHVALATTCPITKSFLPIKHYFHPMRKIVEKRKSTKS